MRKVTYAEFMIYCMKMKFFSIRNYCTVLLFILCGIALNIAGSFAGSHISFPLYLDSLSTIAAAALFGLVPALIVAAGSNCILALLGLVGIPFGICHLMTAVGAWFIFRFADKPYKLESFMQAGLLAALTNGVFGSVISQLVYGGNTTISQVDTVVQGVFTVCGNITAAIYIGGILSNLVDKAFSALVSYCIYRIVTGNKK
jgi:energy-coupling factor transport system substrate-specific component